MRIHAIVVAAGTGSRFRSDTPKQLAVLAGSTILDRALAAIAAVDPDTIVIVASPETIAAAGELARHAPGPAMSVVLGGATRQASVRAGLAALEAAPDDIVLVHDAARPLVTTETVRRVVHAIRAGADGAAPAIPVADTIAVVDGDRIADVPERSAHRRLQTPQAFRAAVLSRAHAAGAGSEGLSSGNATDDCGLVSRHVPEARLVVVPGDETNLKITTPIDLAAAEAILASRDREPKTDR